MDQSNIQHSLEQTRLLRIGGYYDPAAGERVIPELLKRATCGVDDLDNILYYLLNQFTSEDIRDRLKLAAEVHPEEVARRVFGPQEEEDEDAEPAEEAPKKRSRMDDVWDKAVRKAKG